MTSPAGAPPGLLVRRNTEDIIRARPFLTGPSDPQFSPGVDKLGAFFGEERARRVESGTHGPAHLHGQGGSAFSGAPSHPSNAGGFDPRLKRPLFSHFHLAQHLRAALHPLSAGLARWDALVLVALLATAVHVPYRLVFDPAGLAWEDLAVFAAVDAALVADVALAVAWRGFISDGVLVTARAEIARRYLRSASPWIDAAALFPADWIAYAALHRGDPSRLWLVPALRLLRLAKLPGAAHVLARWERTAVSVKLVRLTKVVLFFAASVHAAAVAYFCVARSEGFSGSAWLPGPAFAAAPPARQYALSLSWAAAGIAGLGSAARAGAAAETGLEVSLTLLVLALGVLNLALVIGAVSQILAQLDERAARYRQDLNDLTQFLRHKGVPADLVARVRDWKEYMWSQSRGFDEDLLKILPGHLATDVQNHLHRDLLDRVPLFKLCSKAFLNALVSRLKPEVFAPGDHVIRIGDAAVAMFFVKRGHLKVVSERGVVLNELFPGAFFGEIALLTRSRRTAAVIAVNFCELARLDKTALDEVCAMHADQFALLEAYAIDRYIRTGANNTLRMGGAHVAGAVQTASHAIGALNAFQRLREPRAPANPDPHPPRVLVSADPRDLFPAEPRGSSLAPPGLRDGDGDSAPAQAHLEDSTTDIDLAGLDLGPGASPMDLPATEPEDLRHRAAQLAHRLLAHRAVLSVEDLENTAGVSLLRTLPPRTPRLDREGGASSPRHPHHHNHNAASARHNSSAPGALGPDGWQVGNGQDDASFGHDLPRPASAFPSATAVATTPRPSALGKAPSSPTEVWLRNLESLAAEMDTLSFSPSERARVLEVVRAKLLF